ncbi:MAG: aldose epimerase family protein [Pirellulaceae bacterium]|nr:galactose mutarotase [Planctomycetaceae bacterium]
MELEICPFGEIKGQSAQRFTLRNTHGLELQLTDFGAIVVAVKTPDRHGVSANINLGFVDLAGYAQRHPYFGATVGRYANRIALGQFSIDGQRYQLATNNEPNHLHGGEVGFDRFLWNATPVSEPENASIRFTRTSPDGEEGYPGNLQVAVTYGLNDANELSMVYEASTDRATVLNLTNHNYWNLAGVGAGKILEHLLEMPCDTYVPVTESLIPTGKMESVAGTPLDFRSPQSLGSRLSEVDGDPLGYDHCFVVPGEIGQLRPAARVVDPQSGRVMEVETTQPGIQLYTANFLDSSQVCGGFGQHDAFCLETQHFPDSPNQPTFPSTLLTPGESFHSKTVHRFSVR